MLCVWTMQALSTAVWSVLKAKRQMLKVSLHCFSCWIQRVNNISDVHQVKWWFVSFLMFGYYYYYYYYGYCCNYYFFLCSTSNVWLFKCVIFDLSNMSLLWGGGLLDVFDRGKLFCVAVLDATFSFTCMMLIYCIIHGGWAKFNDTIFYFCS